MANKESLKYWIFFNYIYYPNKKFNLIKSEICSFITSKAEQSSPGQLVLNDKVFTMTQAKTIYMEKM